MVRRALVTAFGLLVLLASHSLAFSVQPTMQAPKRPDVVVCGAGVIGASVAYHLSLRGVNVHIVDKAGVAKAASGKAGGFLALDWNDGSPVGPLSRKSFELHQQLADTLGLDSYRQLTCSAIAVDASGKPASKKLANVEWVDLGTQGQRVMGTEETIAQVHPRQLTEALVAAAKERGCTMEVGSVEGIVVEGVEGKKRATGVTVGGRTIETDKVVIAMGPWSAQAAKGLDLPPMYGQKYHSVLMQNERTLSQAVFFQGLGDPEVYPRPKGEVYVTGFPDSPVTVKEQPGEEEVRAEVTDRLISTVRKVSSELKDAEVSKTQSCHLPLAADGTPVIGKVPGVEGAFVATGHGCWGILNAPATGLAMAELIVDGAASSVPLEAFDPARFAGVTFR